MCQSLIAEFVVAGCDNILLNLIALNNLNVFLYNQRVCRIRRRRWCASLCCDGIELINHRVP